MEEVSMSPVPKKNKTTYSFIEALQKLISGKKIRRLEWPAEDYGLLNDGFISIHRQGIDRRWSISDGDFEAIDWIVIEEVN